MTVLRSSLTDLRKHAQLQLFRNTKYKILNVLYVKAEMDSEFTIWISCNKKLNGYPIAMDSNVH